MCERRINLMLIALVLGLTAGPAHADLVGHWSLDEGTGSVANDRSGNGNHGTVNGATWVDGRHGMALSFNGVDDYVEMPVVDGLEAMSNMTAAAWINYTDAGDGWLGIMANGQQGGPWETYGLFVNRGGTFSLCHRIFGRRPCDPTDGKWCYRAGYLAPCLLHLGRF